MKKLMCLGGNYFQMTATKAAKRLGCYVIDVDYIPDNPAHKYADEYHNISTLDKEAVLALAKEKHIDGIISYASDVSAPTAAYVAENLGLPTNSYDSVYLMTRKDLFHSFLKKNGFCVPKTVYIKNMSEVKEFLCNSNGPIMLKPADSSGSKGVCKIADESQIADAFKEASKYARTDFLVAEEFIQREHYQLDFDIFVVNGKIVYFTPGDQHCDETCNPYVPIGISFPSDLNENKRLYLKSEVQRAVTLLGFENGAINLEAVFDKDGRIFILEMGPRAGGNLIPDAIKMASCVDLAECTVRAALGESLSDLKDVRMNKFVSSYIYHTAQDMIYQDIALSDKLREKIRLSDMFVKPGEQIHRLENGSFGIGAALLEFGSQEEMLYMMDHMNQYYQVNGSNDKAER